MVELVLFDIYELVADASGKFFGTGFEVFEVISVETTESI
jgi:hypothetical protein